MAAFCDDTGEAGHDLNPSPQSGSPRRALARRGVTSGKGNSRSEPGGEQRLIVEADGSQQNFDLHARRDAPAKRLSRRYATDWTSVSKVRILQPLTSPPWPPCPSPSEAVVPLRSPHQRYARGPRAMRLRACANPRATGRGRDPV